MEVVDSIFTLSSLQLILYYFFVVTGLTIILLRLGLSRHIVFIILLSANGLIGFFEYQFGINDNIYKIIIFILVILNCSKGLYKIKLNSGVIINVSFFLFTISYLITHIGDLASISFFSQYILTYAFPFFTYYGYRNLNLNEGKKNLIIKVVFYLILLQIILSFIKLLIIGGVMESIVGSIQFIGGGTAVSLPILGLLFLWVIRYGKFSKYDWFIAFSLIIIAVVSAKRTPVLMFPLFLVLLFLFVNSNKSILSFVKYVPVIMGLVFVGVRLNYTLNPEGVIWGSFDLDYLYNYILWYNFGTSDLSQATELTSGRGGALFLMIQPETLGFKSTFNTLFGNGVVEVVRAESGRFLGGDSYGIKHSGLMGSIVMETYKIGYLGVSLYMLFIFSLINRIKNNRFKIIVSLWVIVDVFLYYGTTIFNPSLSFLFVLIIILSNDLKK